MTILPVLAAVCGAVLVAGVLLVAVGIRGRTVDDSVPGPRAGGRAQTLWRAAATGRRGRNSAAALLAGVVVWAVSGWPVAGAVTALAVPGLPYFFGAARIAKRKIDVLQGLEEWVRRLADSMAAGAMPIQAIVTAASRAPTAIADPVRRLADGLASPREAHHEALHRFAADVDDPLGDMVVIALEIAVTSPSTRTPDMLRVLARQLADDVVARRRIEADRAEPRSEARTIVVVQVLFVVAVAVFTSYADVYGGTGGQLVLAALAAVVVGALVMLRRLSITPAPDRLLGEQGSRGRAVNVAPSISGTDLRKVRP